ncbi:MAG: hypothetical protein DLM58_20430 [Pseudonocardiales bacterium]|nr:MAG: hypothetical protein DLM58_20430 [Pseudonocardiales bacterium]
MDEPTADRRVLELRIHGVSNTPPEAMLDLPADVVEMVVGDELASFWRPKPDSIARLTEHDRGYVRRGVIREAYSWGGMARNSIGGQSGWKKGLAVAARVGWMLLLPFGLVNVAYWARRLDDGPDTGVEPNGPAARTNTRRRVQRRGRGGATLRVVGLLMTLLLTTASAIVPMDLVGIQCYADKERACSSIPSQLGFLAHWSVGERLALLSFVPVLLIVALWALAAKTRTSYDRAASAATEAGLLGAATARKRWPLLTTDGFWQHHLVTSKTALLHVAAAAVLVELTTAWHVLFGAGRQCVTPGDLIHPDRGCRHQLADAGGRGIAELIMVGLGLIAMVVIVALVVHGTEDAVDVARRLATDVRPKQRGVRATVVVATLLFAGQQAILIWWHGAALEAPRLVGISETSAIIICLIFGISLSALFWRRGTRGLALVAGLAIGLLVLLSGIHGEVSWLPRGAVAVIVLVMFVLAMRADTQRRHEAWRGCAPGVALLLALLIAMILSSALLVGIANLLNGRNSAASLAGAQPAATPKPCKYSCDTVQAAATLLLPQPFVWFGAALLAMLGLLLLTLIAASIGAVRRTDKDPSIIDPPPVLDEPEGYARLARTARVFAQLAHRGEALLGLVVLLGTLALLAGLLMAVVWDSPKHPKGAAKLAVGALGPGMWASATVGGLIIALAAGGSALANKRPLGLLWDLICFLPRAGHPMGPPCYAERAVPELLARYDRWFHPKVNPALPGERIVLSAHSLGSVIAVASIFAIDGAEDRPAHVTKLSLLTYGTQLRAYFGRIFPELLGPRVLGNHPVLPAGLIDPNPVVAHQDLDRPVDGRALIRRLDVDATGGRWISLWRRTDYLGFPVYDGIPERNPVDRGAEEIDTTGYMLGVLSHSNYPRTAAYREALDDLVDATNAGATDEP